MLFGMAYENGNIITINPTTLPSNATAPPSLKLVCHPNSLPNALSE